MGSGREKHPMKEISDTKASAKDDLFEEILDRIETAGEITKDEESPLYTEIGTEEFEVGRERVVEFTVNKTEFKLIRKVETHRLSGAGRQKHLEKMDTPRIDLGLKKRIGYSTDWQIVDMEDMF